jgi:hypothetical protein
MIGGGREHSEGRIRRGRRNDIDSRVLQKRIDGVGVSIFVCKGEQAMMMKCPTDYRLD